MRQGIRKTFHLDGQRWKLEQLWVLPPIRGLHSSLLDSLERGSIHCVTNKPSGPSLRAEERSFRDAERPSGVQYGLSENTQNQNFKTDWVRGRLGQLF